VRGLGNLNTYKTQLRRSWRVECFAQTTALCTSYGECAMVMDKALNACLAAAPVFVPPTAGGN